MMMGNQSEMQEAACSEQLWVGYLSIYVCRLGLYMIHSERCWLVLVDGVVFFLFKDGGAVPQRALLSFYVYGCQHVMVTN